ncbi:MAG: (d)CMP kinase [Bacteroides sp.]|nr:(d)CMP kinase [Bacteroides sp.]MCM1379226.1 (d)CMP kinase [Bacteroides sp.]MCM1445116.1 (d)CMP kinase [Prevotella sp.]
MTSKIIIAIDGYSSSGKSSMAKALARKIGYRYVDTGAMYRAVTLLAMEQGLINDGKVDEPALIEALRSAKIDFAVTPEGQHTLLNGRDVEREIRSMEVSGNVSTIAAIPAVRRDLVERQRVYGEEKGIVMDGRDIGTTVFPNAELKIFVNAPAEVRAERRYKELTEKGTETTYEEVLENVRHRDHIDTTRAESPLRRAADAVDLDNSHMTIAEQDAWLISKYEEAAHRD